MARNLDKVKKENDTLKNKLNDMEGMKKELKRRNTENEELC